MRIPEDSPTIFLMYKLREFSLKEIDRTIASYHGPAPITSQLRRVRNIINQSDPEDIFGHLNADRLEKLVLGYAEGKDLPKYLTGQSGSPDKQLFNSLRKFFSANIHHGNPLAQNTNAINPTWDYDDLYTFHRTLNKLGTGAGSSKKGLINAIFKEHLAVFHKGGTKVDAFGPLMMEDPELAAAEFMINNSGNQKLIDDFKANPNTMTRRVIALFEANPTMNQKGFLQSLNRLSLTNQFTKLAKTEQALDKLKQKQEGIDVEKWLGNQPLENQPSIQSNGMGGITWGKGLRLANTAQIMNYQLGQGDMTSAAFTGGQAAAWQYMQTAHGQKTLSKAVEQILKKRAATTLAKGVPLLDIAISAGEVKDYLAQEKYDQAFIAGLSGLVGWIPGKGDAIAAGLDLENTRRDIKALKNETQTPEPQPVPEQPVRQDLSDATRNFYNQPGSGGGTLETNPF